MTLQEVRELIERLESVNLKEVVPAGFWYEDLYENGRIKGIHYSDEMRSMLGYTREEFPDTLETLVNHLHPDDRQMMLDAAIAAGTGKSDGYNVEYRILQADGKYMWVNATGKLIKKENGIPEGMYGAFLDISERKLKERDMEIIDVLTSEYTGVYFVNLKTGEATPYSMNAYVKSEVGSAFQGPVKYIEAYRMCVENLVLDEDKAMMTGIGTIGNIMRELKNKKTFSAIYHDATGKYCEMKFIKMGDAQGVPEVVALCFSEKDEEFRSKEETARRMSRNLDIIGILASEYTSVYYIDMDTDELDTYTMNEETESEFGQVFRAGIKYSSAFRMYVDTLVYPADREMMLRAGSMFNILDELADKKTFITRYRNAAGRYCEMKFVKVGDERYPKAVALGFSDKDEAIKAQMRQERQGKAFTDLIDDFACINYIDILTDSDENTTPYRTSELLKQKVPGWEKELNFRRRLELLCEHVVAEDERDQFMVNTSKAVVLRTLRMELAYDVRFNAVIDGEKHEYEFKFTADKDASGNIIGVVSGFRRIATGK